LVLATPGSEFGIRVSGFLPSAAGRPVATSVGHLRTVNRAASNSIHRSVAKEVGVKNPAEENNRADYSKLASYMPKSYQKLRDPITAGYLARGHLELSARKSKFRKPHGACPLRPLASKTRGR
jgi:hypothetical protein